MRKRWASHEAVAMSAADLASGKDHRDENFPVASIFIARKYRPALMAFYRFARAADDVADNANALPAVTATPSTPARQTAAGSIEKPRRTIEA